jgi:hypothetical protein
MNRRSGKDGRLALLAVAVVVVGAMLALPATAYAAKATTRIVAVKSMTVNRNTSGVNPWPKALAVKLQKRISATHYHALSGTVKLYRWDPTAGDAGAYRLVASKKGSSLSFSLPGRGKYKLTYAGSTAAKASTAYSAVYETIGVVVSTPVITIDPISATQYWVNVKYNLNWNTEAVNGPVVLVYEGWFEDTADEVYTAWIYCERDTSAPQAVEFNYKVASADVQPDLKTEGSTYVDDWYRGAYVKTPAKLPYTYNVP